jgi:hypothetical protein
LNVIAAYELCGALGDQQHSGDRGRMAPFLVLRQALGLPSSLIVMPVTYSECSLSLDYDAPVPRELAEAFHIPATAVLNDGHRLHGQSYIDKLPHRSGRTRVGVSTTIGSPHKPAPNPEYLRRMREAKLYVMGAGSLIGSQLAQFCIPEVVDTLLERTGIRRILVFNHVKMDETLGMSLREQVQLIEVSVAPFATAWSDRSGRAPWISDLFTDVVVPRTIAREIEMEMMERGVDPGAPSASPPVTVQVPRRRKKGSLALVANKYIRFLLDHPYVRDRYDISDRELEVLSFLDQPPMPSRQRTEKGRYRGALYATQRDIDYLVEHGIPRRRIHEVDCVGENNKFIKEAGVPSLEFFPGLVPEALLGIFRIALERARST